MDEMFFCQKLIQIQLRVTLIAGDNTPKNCIATFRANIAGFFILNPFFSTHLPPIWNGPKNHFFPDGHGEIFDMLTGEIVTFMASGKAYSPGAVTDSTLAAVHEPVIREASAASDILRQECFTVGKAAFSLNFSLIQIGQPFLEFLIVITMGNINGAYAAIQAAGGNKVRIDLHRFNSPVDLFISDSLDCFIL